jgi:hypothetical protein
MLFTNYALHFSIIGTVQSGFKMLKVVVFNSDEFSNPVEVFFYGISVIAVNLFVEFTNMYHSVSQKDFTSVIAKFVGFKVLI